MIWYDNIISLKVLEDIYMDLLKIFDLSDITNILAGEYMTVLSKYLLPAAIPVLIIALINCFLGYKVFKTLVGVVGLLVGAGLGVGIVSGVYTITLNKMPGALIMVIAAIVGAAVIGFSSYKLYKGGAFCMGFVTGMILGVVIMKIMNKDEYIIAGVIGGLLMGLLAIDLYRHVVILLTSINGGFVSAACLAIILSKDDPTFILKFGIALSVIGILVQYILLYMGKKNAKPEGEEDDEEEEEFIPEQKRNKKQIEPKKEKKTNKAPAKKAKVKEKRNSQKQKQKKKKQEKKNYNFESDFFLVEIFSNIAQSVKDFVVDKFDLDTIEDDDFDEDEDIFEEDDSIEEDNLFEVDDSNENDDAFTDIESHQKEERKVYDFDVKKYSLKEKAKENVIENEKWKETAVKMQTKQPTPVQMPEQRIINEEEITKQNKTLNSIQRAPVQTNNESFDLDDIALKLEKELDHSLEVEEDRELEDLIIKELYRNLDK